MIDPIQNAMDDLADAQAELEKANECGDLEDRLEAALAVEDAERRLTKLRIDYPYNG